MAARSGFRISPFGILCLIGVIASLYLALVWAPRERVMGDIQRIMYFHVATAWIAELAFCMVGLASVIYLWLRERKWDILAHASAEVGFVFCCFVMVTGPIWGKPVWGTWWTWDLRLTSELVLLFIYLGIIALYSTYEDKRTASRAVAVLTLVCVVNIPIIHYSIQWLGDKTLHQANSVSVGKSSMDVSMLIPLLVMSFAFKFLFAAIVIMRSRSEVLLRESNSRWVEGVLGVEK